MVGTELRGGVTRIQKGDLPSPEPISQIQVYVQDKILSSESIRDYLRVSESICDNPRFVIHLKLFCLILLRNQAI